MDDLDTIPPRQLEEMDDFLSQLVTGNVMAADGDMRGQAWIIVGVALAHELEEFDCDLMAVPTLA